MDVPTRSTTVDLMCPVCSEAHSFPLNISYTLVMHMMTATMSTDPTPRVFRRVFVCPKTAKGFKASVKLSQAFGETIHDVAPGAARDAKAAEG